MQTRIRERPAPVVAGSLAVIGGVAVWQLGLEFERAWLGSYEGPLLGETLPEPARAGDGETGRMDGGRGAGGSGGRRRWVSEHHPRRSPQTRNGTSSNPS
jgi:hypothetical protein